jgi:hypothetical protein
MKQVVLKFSINAEKIIGLLATKKRAEHAKQNEESVILEADLNYILKIQ